MEQANEIKEDQTDMEVKEGIEVSPLLREMEEVEIEAAERTSLKVSVKKPKEASKQNPSKAINHTVPRPFVLATEKRMSRERRASVDFSSSNENRPVIRERHGSLDFSELSKPSNPVSLSSNGAQLSSTPAGSIAKRSATLKASSNKVTDKSYENGVEGRSKTHVIKGVDRKYTLVKKNETEASSARKLGKNSTFKGLPLPSFYHKNDSASPKPENKGDLKMADQSKSPTLSKPIKANKSIENKPKKGSASRTMSHRAKETINRMIKTTQKALNPSKETAKVIATTA